MVMTIAISSVVLDRILALAAACPDEEVCGLLLGDPDHVTAIVPTANVAPDRRRHFEVDPAALIAAHRDARNGGPALLGHYHSHPGGDALPSARDAADAEPGRLWLIVAGQEAALFASVDGGDIHQRFNPICMERVAQPAAGRQKDSGG